MKQRKPRQVFTPRMTQIPTCFIEHLQICICHVEDTVIALNFVSGYRGILVYNICLISISNSVSDGAKNKSVLNIERSKYD